jgi:uncharacterized membrane protein YdjX (TVP38/TMEM64 family)
MFWFAILANVTVYVAGSMTGKEPDFMIATVVGAIAGLIASLIGIVANIEPETPSHH